VSGISSQGRPSGSQGDGSGLIPKTRYPTLRGDVPTADFSGWPVYCRTDTADELVELFCRAMVSRRDDIVWDIGGVRQPPLPLERMVNDSPATPIDVTPAPARRRRLAPARLPPVIAGDGRERWAIR
jgi:hypothetical protein